MDVLKEFEFGGAGAEFARAFIGPDAWSTAAHCVRGIEGGELALYGFPVTVEVPREAVDYVRAFNPDYAMFSFVPGESGKVRLTFLAIDDG